MLVGFGEEERLRCPARLQWYGEEASRAAGSNEFLDEGMAWN